MNKLELIISSEIGNIVKVESFIENFTESFGVQSETFGKISLSVVEAVNNAILAGNKQCADKKVKLEAWKENDCLYVSVEDEGEGFDYTVIPDPTSPGNVVKDAGRGLYLMKVLSDELKFENNGSKVILAFKL